MQKIITLFILKVLLVSVPVQAVEKLILEFDADEDMISMSHNIDKFKSVVPSTMNFAVDVPGNLSERLLVEQLKHHLAVVVRVTLDGEIAGIATELETVKFDSDTGEQLAESAWLILLSHPKMSGFLAVTQREDGSSTIGLVKQVMGKPDKKWEDKYRAVLSTTSKPLVYLATGDLSVYKGGGFEEYNLINPADYKKLGRFRAKGRFIIYPPK